MGDENDGAFVFGDGLEDFVAGGGVEVVGGLVEEEDVGAGGDERGEGETGLFAAGEDPGGFEGVVAGEEEGAEDGTSLSVVELGGDVGEVLKHGSVEIEGVVLLGEVADLAAVAVFDDAGVGVFDVGEQAQGGGFSGAGFTHQSQRFAVL